MSQENNPTSKHPLIPRQMALTPRGSNADETGTPRQPSSPQLPEARPNGAQDISLEYVLRLRVGKSEPLELSGSMNAPGILHESMLEEAMRNFTTLTETAIFRPMFVRVKEELDNRVQQKKSSDDFPRV